MTRRTRLLLFGIGAGIVVAGIGGGAAVAAGVVDGDRPITGPARARAEAAALAYVGGGRVSETEVGDEDSYYEVEVSLPDGRRIDVQLDRNFTVVGSESDGQPDDEQGATDDGLQG